MGISEFCRLTPNTYTYLGLEDAADELKQCIRLFLETVMDIMN